MIGKRHGFLNGNQGTKNQWAHQCYVNHWGDVDNNTGIDIALVDKKEIPDHNLLVGGFPCQDYSVAHSLSSSKGLEGKKGVLWWQIRDILEEKKAPFVLLENVDRLLKSPAKQRGRDFGVILSCFAQLDYSVEWRVINAAEYGAAQRRRIFIFAYKNTTKYGIRNANQTAEDIILHDGLFPRAFPPNDITYLLIHLPSIMCCPYYFEEIFLYLQLKLSKIILFKNILTNVGNL